MVVNDYVDNCPVCRAIQKAEQEGKDLTRAQLKASFREAKESGVLVSGWEELCKADETLF